jgi:hypothetical protein
MARAKKPTIADIVARVDGDPERARAELEAEQSQPRPRTSLIGRLEAIAAHDLGAALTLVEAVATGDRKAALVALRDHLADRLEDPRARCVGCGGLVPLSVPTAGVAKELRAVVDELAKLVPPKESTADELKKKRDARLHAAQVPVRAARRDEGGGRGGPPAR